MSFPQLRFGGCNCITFWSVSFLFCTFSIPNPDEAEEETGLSPDLHHQLWQLQYIYCCCFANSVDLVIEDAWIFSHFSACCHDFFFASRGISFWGGQICTVSGCLEKGKRWFKAMFLSSVQSLLQWRYHSCVVLMTSSFLDAAVCID